MWDTFLQAGGPFILLMGAVFAGVVVFALLVKVFELRRARNWPITTGRVLKSRLRARKRRSINGSTGFENEPLVAYEYEVDGRRYHGTRVSLAERIRGPQAAQTLAHYPEGKEVTVYYNPDRPEEALLERELAPMVSRSALGLAAVFLGGAVLLAMLVVGATSWLASWLPRPELALFVTLTTGLAAFDLLLIFALQRQAQAAQGWARASGRILSAEAMEYREPARQGERIEWRRRFRPRVVYAYDVNGEEYYGERIAFGGVFFFAGAARLRPTLERYPAGSQVMVYYDPEHPEQAVLERRVAGLWLLIAIAIGLFMLALFGVVVQTHR